MGIQKASISSRSFVIIATILLTTMTIRPVAAELAAGDCVEFEDLTLGTVYLVPAIFTSSGTTLTTSAFRWSNGIWFSGGSATVRDANASGGTGYDLQLNNITVGFDFGRSIDSLRLFFGEYGGNVNLTINGDFRNLADLDEADGQIVGGATVEVNISPAGFGVMIIDGTVDSFSIGGQELWIDNICEGTGGTGCIEFEDLPIPQTYNYGQFFVDSGTGMWLDEFFWLPSGSTTAGFCLVDDSQLAGGTGQDLHLNNTNIHFGLGEPLAEVTVLYRDFGGNINLIVNEVLANVADMTDLHMMTLGGATITLQPPSGSSGQVTVSGLVNSIAVGGQELWIDRACGVPSEIFSDGFESGDTIAWSTAVGLP